MSGAGGRGLWAPAPPLERSVAPPSRVLRSEMDLDDRVKGSFSSSTLLLRESILEADGEERTDLWGQHWTLEHLTRVHFKPQTPARFRRIKFNIQNSTNVQNCDMHITTASKKIICNLQASEEELKYNLNWFYTLKASHDLTFLLYSKTEYWDFLGRIYPNWFPCN